MSVVDTTFVVGSGFDNAVFATKAQPDGKLLVGGSFTTYKGNPVNKIVRLNQDGSVDTNFTTAGGTGPDNNVYDIVCLSTNEILIVGVFDSFDGTASTNIAKLDSTGALITSFSVATGTGFDNAPLVAFEHDGFYYLGGLFSQFNGSSVGRIAKISSSGSLNIPFNTAIGTGANSAVNDIAITNNSIYLVGSFTSFNGTTARGLVNLSLDGTFNTAFNTAMGTGFLGACTAIEIVGSLFIGGSFTSFNGISVGGIAKINTDGSLDLSFNKSGTGFVGAISNRCVKRDSLGNIYVAGFMTQYNGKSIGKIVKLSTNGVLNPLFAKQIGTGFDNNIADFVIQSNEKISLGGEFAFFQGVSYNKIIRLDLTVKSVSSGSLAILKTLKGDFKASSLSVPVSDNPPAIPGAISLASNGLGLIVEKPNGGTGNILFS